MHLQALYARFFTLYQNACIPDVTLVKNWTIHNVIHYLVHFVNYDIFQSAVLAWSLYLTTISDFSPSVINAI